MLTSEGEWTIEPLKQSGCPVILHPANPATDATFPPYIDRRLIPNPSVGAQGMS